MKIKVIAVGKIKERSLRTLIDDYLGRIQRYAACEELEIKDGPDAEIVSRLTKLLPSRGRVIALEVSGTPWTSKELAQFLGASELGAVPSLCFLIGGAYGLPATVSARADRRLSLSCLTLPHRLARLILVEQLYRGFTILRNEPYSHD